jgi:hypothetical protein
VRAPTSSSKAQDRELAVWYSMLGAGQVRLPRFQRFEAWDRQRIKSFLNTIVHNLPVGITLVLVVDEKEKFQSSCCAPKTSARRWTGGQRRRPSTSTRQLTHRQTRPKS